MVGRGLVVAALAAAGCGRIGYQDRGDDVAHDAAVDAVDAPTACALRSISAGPENTCIVGARGDVWCWGLDSGGAASGTTGSNQPVLVPGTVPLPRPAVEVETGYRSACARLDDGTVRCWGWQAAGQGGAPYPGPTEIQLSDASSLGAGYIFACAIAGADDHVECWGNGVDGGLGQVVAESPTPVMVPGSAGATALWVGGQAACAAIGGSTHCWGRNLGQLALGIDDDLPYTPRAVGALAGLDAFAFGDEFACALDGGDLRCWGHNDRGQLATTAGNRYDPGPVVASGVREIAAMSRSACMIDGTGQVACWGQNRGGELGQDDLARQHAPVPIAGLTDVTALTAGDHHACAEQAGQLWCWGEDEDGQLGRGSRAIAAPPRQVAAGVGSFTRVSMSDWTVCAVDSGGALWCWGDNEFGQAGLGNDDGTWTPTKIIPSGVVNVALGAYHGCARDDEGVLCWGQNYWGQLGNDDPSGTKLLSPTRMLASTAPPDVAAGFGHACAIDGPALRCWGSNGHGELGVDDGSTLSRRPLKLYLQDDEPPASVAAGNGPGASHTCAVAVTGTLRCWGYNSHGQLGRDSGGMSLASGNDVVHPNARKFLTVAAGEAHTCAIDEDRELWCWGKNGAGQLGAPDTDDHFVPHHVALPGPVASVHARWDSTCAILMSGASLCWGDGAYKISDGGPTPFVFGGLTDVVDFGGSYYDLCAVRANGELWCAGLGTYGQLGTDLVGHPMPVTFAAGQDPWACPSP